MSQLPDINTQAFTPAQPSASVASYDAGQVARAQAQVGQAQAQFGADVAQAAAVQVEHFDAIKAQDAINQLHQAKTNLTMAPPEQDGTGGGFLNMKGAATMGLNGQPAMLDSYRTQFNDSVSQIGAKLTGNAARRYQEQAKQISVNFQSDLLRHAMTEADAYHTNVATLAIGNYQQQAAHANGNMDQIIQARQGLIDNASSLYTAKGIRQSDLKQAMLPDLSRMHTEVVKQALAAEGPYAVAFASQYLKDNKGEMTGDDILSVSDHITKSENLGTATSAAERVMATAVPSSAPMQNLLAWRTKKETGNRGDYNPDGSPVLGDLVKGERAMFSRQVRPSTAAAPGFGIRPAAAQTAKEYNRVGDELLVALVQKYGNAQMAMAAYHAGSGAVDEVVKKGGKEWLSQLGPKTQAYAGDVPPNGVTASYTPIPTLQQKSEEALALLPPGASLQLKELTLSVVARKHQAVLQDVAVSKENAVKPAQQYLAQTNGDWAGFTVRPEYQDVVRNAPGELDNLKLYAKKMSEPTAKSNPEFMTWAITHSDEAAKMPDSTWRQVKALYVSTDDAEKVDGWRAAALHKNQTVDNSAQALDTSAFNSIADQRLKDIGIDPAATMAKDKSAAQQVATIKMALQESVYSRQRQLGRKLTQEEMTTHIDKEFTRSVPAREQSFWGGSAPAKAVLGLKYSDIPAADVEGLTSRLQATGIQSPSQSQVLGAYLKLKLQPASSGTVTDW